MNKDDRESSELPEGTLKDADGNNISRRSFLGAGAALAGGGAALTAWGTSHAQDAATDSSWRDDDDHRPDSDREIAFATIAQLQAKMAAKRLTSTELVHIYLRRIQEIEGKLDLNAIIQLNPDAFRIAIELDHERRRTGPRGPLHGIPILLKDNIDTGDRTRTTAGSLALFGAPALRDATVAARLRRAGAVILGKANLSEWANFRGFGSSSGWSGVGKQCRNPHILDRNPCGSSSGSAAAVAAALAVGFARNGDGRFGRLPVRAVRRGRDQAHRGSHQSRWRSPDIRNAGHGRLLTAGPSPMQPPFSVP